MAATHLARKAEAVLTVALTLQLVTSLSCGHARVLLRGGDTAAGGNEPDFGLQHAGLSAQAYAQGHDHHRYARKARTMHAADRQAEETYGDWNKLQDGYDAEMRLHRERLEATSGIQLLAAQPMQPGTDAAQQHTVAAVHRPLFAGTEVPKRDEEDAPAQDSNEDNDAVASQHTVDQQEEDKTEPAQVQGADDDAGSADIEDIHSSSMDGTVVVGEEVPEPQGRRRLLARRLLLDGQQQQPAATTAADSGVSWSVRTLQQLTSPFGALGMFASATDPVQIVSSAAAIKL